MMNYFYLKKENRLQNNIIVALFFLLFFLVGNHIYDSYGISLDEEGTRAHGFMNLKYIYEIFFPSQVSIIDNYITVPKLKDFFSNDHGAFLDTFFAFIEINYGLNDSKDYYLMRHYFCFIITFWQIHTKYK